MYFTPKSYRLFFPFFYLFIVCTAASPVVIQGWMYYIWKMSQEWNTVALPLSVLEQLYTYVYLPIDISRLNSCGGWSQKYIFTSTATNEKQKIMSLPYVTDIVIKMHNGDEGRGREERNLSIWVIYACKCKEYKRCQIQQPWRFESSEMSLYHSNKHCNADFVHSLTFRGIFYQISIFVYSADGGGESFH